MSVRRIEAVDAAYLRAIQSTLTEWSAQRTRMRTVSFDALTSFSTLPFTDRQATKNRPALVLSSDRKFNRKAAHSVMAMTHERAFPLATDCDY